LNEFTIDESFVERTIPPRSRDAHKRMNGTVCVVGGSRMYHGAPYLCGCGALRTGVDIVYIAVPAVIATAVRSLSPDFIVVPLPDGKLTRGNTAKLLAWVKNVDCFAVGPGLGPQSGDGLAGVVAELKVCAKGVVVDADALRPQVLASVGGTGTVLTPHAGEFERLFGAKLPDRLDEAETLAAEQAKKFGVTLLLKGPTDIVTDGDRVGLNTVHSPGMTVGGTGDVLTGIAAGLVAKGVAGFEAACCAAFVNGSAGLKAAETKGLHISATDVVNEIANVMKRYDRLA